ncbi:sensor domain-containing diguanylate cyclase [Shewanella mesophila]|nr:sensor domain-containing diguanylate cyclase [Shewanella mesophila]
MEITNSAKSHFTYTKYKRTFIYATLLLAFLFIVIAAVYVFSRHNMAREREVTQYAELANIQNSLVSELSIVGADLVYYSHSQLAISTLVDESPTAKTYLTSLMYQIGDLHKHYDQVRLFNLDGDEVIRIDLDNDNSLKLIPDNKLQNKSDRYYFRDLVSADPKVIYTSPFDLNIEHGKVEFPIKPTIRFATPIHSKQGAFIGAGVINYNGRKLIEIIEKLNIHKGDSAYLINSDGYYLRGSHAYQEWRFMFPEQEQIRFADDYPSIWQRMRQTDKAKVTTEAGEYYFSHFQLSPNSTFKVVNGESVFLVMFVPHAKIEAAQKTLNIGTVLAFILIAPMFIFLAYKLASSQVEQNRLFKQLNFEARHDALTGLFNRQAIVDYLEKCICSSQRRDADLAVSFVDVNDLKKTNDQYGHEAGDELIQGMATVINMSIRECDYAARIGGDEFLIVFVDCDEKNANIVMQRIQSAYGVLGISKTDRKWNMSFGCTQRLYESDDVDSMIERADRAMYEHKAAQKNPPVS